MNILNKTEDKLRKLLTDALSAAFEGTEAPDFLIEVPKDKWESCTTWFSDVLTEFINTHEFVLIA